PAAHGARGQLALDDHAVAALRAAELAHGRLARGRELDDLVGGRPPDPSARSRRLHDPYASLHTLPIVFAHTAHCANARAPAAAPPRPAVPPAAARARSARSRRLGERIAWVAGLVLV